jgi:hypothetical protein
VAGATWYQSLRFSRWLVANVQHGTVATLLRIQMGSREEHEGCNQINMYRTTAGARSVTTHPSIIGQTQYVDQRRQ